MSDVVFNPVPRLASELQLPAARVAAALGLFDEQNTVPFIARYRKEVTGGLDEVQLRAIEERRTYLVELEQRRATIVERIAEQGKLTPELQAKIAAADTKSVLEDLYLPYKRKRRTRATVARERGLEPLAALILAQPETGNLLTEAAPFVDVEREVPDVEAALAGARDIVAETVAENAEVRAETRRRFAETGILVACVRKKTDERTKFEQYYDFREPVSTVPSHRYLAIRRGEREDVLRAHIEIDVEALLGHLQGVWGMRRGSPFADQLGQALQDGYERLLAPSVESEVRVELKLGSDRAAVDVFADNLRHLLLAPPLGTQSVVGIDPGLRTGCKCAAVDTTGKLLGHVTIHLTKGDAALARARKDLLAFFDQHSPVAVAVGNGTGGRETEAFVRELLSEHKREQPFAVQVNEAGASVYSASDVAREEFAELDLTIRGAISIARRLQDPLAELVKIDPKAIGVGQYQHDVHQPLLQRKLGEVVESCVNGVGVDLNTASAPLLAYVAGVGSGLAKKIVAHREANGAFPSRKELLKVSGLGPRAFEQAAGFMRIRGGEQPLDASAVHPERYGLVQRMAADLGVAVAELVGSPALVDRIEQAAYVDDTVGEATLGDIVDELKKPGRDPRQRFEPPRFRDDVKTMEDLKQGMALEGVVTNVTAFGAFVDIGVHQDGLVHISELSDRFVRDPREVVHVGDRLTTRVLDIDLVRKRIALTARSERPPKQEGGKAEQAARPQPSREPRRGDGNRGGGGGKPRRTEAPKSFGHNPFAVLKSVKPGGR